MFDFYFGTQEEILKDEPRFLLGVKRMLPRWVNSIPDSEFLAIYDILERFVSKDRPVLIETGAGASSLVMLYFAFKHGGRLYSWDFVGPKGAFLRGVAVDCFGPLFHTSLQDHWRFIAGSSHSPDVGIPILGELGEKVDFGFFDSEHTWDVLRGELERAEPFLKDGAVVALDDANYDFAHANTAYANMIRRKLGLPPVPEPSDNRVRPFYQEAEGFLKRHWSGVEPIQDAYKPNCRNDMFFSYYRTDREVMNAAGMEKLDALEHRFDAWKVQGRR
ncbi:MAG: class I SAM-dependent methyltransferase [Elusimicrobia bacterium]|nr:class I SAM-dependent methyltransferase [Elusimicrobiota bacterium]